MIDISKLHCITYQIVNIPTNLQSVYLLQMFVKHLTLWWLPQNMWLSS